MIRIKCKDGKVIRYQNATEYFNSNHPSSSDIKHVAIFPKKEEKAGYKHSKAMMEALSPYVRKMKGYKTDFTVIDKISLFDHPNTDFIWMVRDYGTHLEYFDIEDFEQCKYSLEWIEALVNTYKNNTSLRIFLWQYGRGLKEIDKAEAVYFANMQVELATGYKA